MSVRSIMKSPNVLLVSGIAFNSSPNVIQTGAYMGGGGGIDTIVAGDGIVVDNTDPANPEVSTNYENTANYNDVGTIENCAGIQITSGGLNMTAGRFLYQSVDPITITDANSGIDIQNGSLVVGGESTFTGDVSCVGALSVNGAFSTTQTAPVSTLNGLTVENNHLTVNTPSNLNGLVTVGVAGISFSDGTNQTTAYLGGGGGGSDFNTLITGSDGLTITAGLTTIDGGAIITAGGLQVSQGLAVSTGNITATIGNITATAGGITATAGAITATAGAVVAGSTVTAGTGIIATAGGITFGGNATAQTVPYIVPRMATALDVEMGTGPAGTANTVPVSITTLNSNNICYFTIIFPAVNFIPIEATAGGYFFATPIGALPDPRGDVDYNGLTVIETTPNTPTPFYFSVVSNGQFYIWFPDTTPVSFYGQSMSGSYMTV